MKDIDNGINTDDLFDEDCFDSEVIEDEESEFPIDDNEEEEGDDKPMTILTALDYVQANAFHSALNKTFWQKCEKQFDFLCEKLEINRNQVLITAILCETGDTMSWHKLAKFMGISRIKAMTFTDDVEEMKRRRLIRPAASYETGGRYEGIKLAPNTIYAFRHNEKFVPENLKGLSEQVFVDRLARYIRNEGQDCNITTNDNINWLLAFVEDNNHLPLCSKILEMRDEFSRILTLLVVADYAMYANTSSLGLNIGELYSWVSTKWNFEDVAQALREGNQELFHKNIIEHGCEDGLVDTEKFVLTSSAVKELLNNYSLHKKKNRPEDKDLILSKDISERSMFYNDNERIQIERLRKILSPSGLSDIQKRLSEIGLRKGVACLFYGAPGTGKTETVLQLARESGRDIMQVDIAGIRDKFVGESEKNIKGVFERYKALCQSCEITPILFFNEADALINSRLERTSSSVEKMDNAIQNILLQEMENLEGIMIATTNLTGTLDKAFDRRFLFKVEFNLPCRQAKEAIWQRMLPQLDDKSCSELAEEFDFSGGQIENISRKCSIDYILTGKTIVIDDIRAFCREEFINRSSLPKVGF